MIEITETEILDAINSLLSSDKRMYSNAFDFLSENCKITVPIMCDKLLTVSDKHRWKILQVLSPLKDTRSVPVLIFCLTLPNSAIASFSAQILSKIGTDECVVGLLNTLENNLDLHPLAITAIVNVLGNIGNTCAVSSIIRVMHETSSNIVRYTSISSLIKLGDPSAIVDIAQYISDEDHHVRNYAENAIRGMHSSI